MSSTPHATTTDSGAGQDTHPSPAAAYYRASYERSRYWLAANALDASSADRASSYTCFVLSCEPAGRLGVLVMQIAGAETARQIAAGAHHQACQDHNTTASARQNGGAA